MHIKTYSHHGQQYVHHPNMLLKPARSLFRWFTHTHTHKYTLSPPYDPHALIFLITTQTHLHFSCSHSSLPLLAISIVIQTILTHHLMRPTWCRLTRYTFLELMKKRCNACENSPSRCTLIPFALSSTPIFFLLFSSRLLLSSLPPVIVLRFPPSVSF